MSERARRLSSRIVAWLVGLAALSALAVGDPVITRSWRTALIERTLINPSGAQWILLQATSALGADPYSMIQMDVDKDQTAWAGSNGVFCDTTGNYTICAHQNLDAAADNAIGEVMGVHGAGQFGLAMDIDDPDNTATGIRIAQGGANGNATQNLLDFDGEEDFASGTYGGTFTGRFINAEIRDVLKFRVDYQGNVTTGGSVLAYSTGGVGYGPGVGAGGTVTQGAGSGKATGVTLNKISGAITMDGAALAAAAEATFVVTNSTVAAADVVIVNHSSAGTAGAYLVGVSAVGAGSFTVTVSNVSAGSLSEAIVLSFAVIKGAAS